MTLTPPTPHLTTERLLLEPLRIFHAAEMVQVLADHELYEFTGGEPPTYEQLTRRYTMMYAGSRQKTEQWHNWIVRHRETQKAVGHVQATVTAVQVDVAWTIGTSWQRQGYAKEATKAMYTWLHEHGVPSFGAWIHPDHVGSHSVARSLGMGSTSDIDEDGEQLWLRPS